MSCKRQTEMTSSAVLETGAAKQVIFQTHTHGKWILTGEHAVVRGRAALVFPFDEQGLDFIVEDRAELEAVEVNCMHGNSTHMALWVHRVLECALRYVAKPSHLLTGKIRIDSNIPPGLGLGSSAALCVAIARWFAYKQWITEAEISNFARELEHLFHGRSSGLDIAGVNAKSGIYFKQGEVEPINMAWQPDWKLTSCGEEGNTATCIERVQTLWQRHPDVASEIDVCMGESVDLARRALETDTPFSRQQLKQAIELGHQCFEAWELITPALEKHIQALYDQGAIAVKPTGSGCGGMVVSLW